MSGLSVYWAAPLTLLVFAMRYAVKQSLPAEAWLLTLFGLTMWTGRRVRLTWMASLGSDRYCIYRANARIRRLRSKLASMMCALFPLTLLAIYAFILQSDLFLDTYYKVGESNIISKWAGEKASQEVVQRLRHEIRARLTQREWVLEICHSPVDSCATRRSYGFA